MKYTSGSLTFEIRRCPAVPSAQSWQKLVRPRYTHLLSGEAWPEVVFMKELQPKSHTSNMVGQATQVCMKHRNWGAEKGSRCSGCSRRQFVRRRAEEQCNNECLQATVKHGGGSLNICVCISANGVGDLIMVTSMLRNTGRYLSIVQYHRRCV